MWLELLQAEIALRLGRGENVADVEAELIDSAVGLSDDERAALWMFAWSYRGDGGRERGAAGLAQ